MENLRVRKKSESGIALLESLIAILIFSLGILGVIAMHAVGIKTVSDARYRTEAGLLADEMMGRLWGNVANAATFNGFDTADTLNPLPDDCTTDETGAGMSCRWGKKVLAQLPNARARIAVAAAGIAGSTATQVTITINWTPPGQVEALPADATFGGRLRKLDVVAVLSAR